MPDISVYSNGGTSRTKPYQDESSLVPISEHFEELLPRRPYCSNNPRWGTRVRGVASALKYTHLQFNDRRTLRWFVFDVDHPDAAFAWEEALLPAPNIVAGNPENGHAHLFWALARPVHTSVGARASPLAYAADIERGMCRRLAADPFYRGPLAKNPRSRRWRVLWPSPRPYMLEHLDGFLTAGDKQLPPSMAEATGLGRNCALFDELRSLAYAEARSFDRSTGESHFHHTILEMAGQLNSGFFASPGGPLSRTEVRTIARSVAKFSWREFRPEKFSAIQRYRAEARTRRNLQIINEIKNGRP